MKAERALAIRNVSLYWGQLESEEREEALIEAWDELMLALRLLPVEEAMRKMTEALNEAFAKCVGACWGWRGKTSGRGSASGWARLLGS